MVWSVHVFVNVVQSGDGLDAQGVGVRPQGHRKVKATL